MAAGKFFFYDSWGKYEVSGDANFMRSAGIKGILLKSSYTPGTSTHSALAQISGFQATSSGSIVNSVALGGRHISTSGTNVIKYLGDSMDFSAGGSDFKAKYLALYQDASASGLAFPIMGFFDLDTGSTTGVEASQVTITWPSGGIAKKLINQ